MKQKAIIYVPGLNDLAFPNKTLTSLLPILWKHFGFSVFLVRPQWNKGTWNDKFKLILSKIDELYNQGYDVYLFGQSAGGAAVLNAYVERKQKVKKVINICGRLEKGAHVFPSLEKAAKGNPAFAESVLLFETTNKEKLNIEDKKKILLIKPLFDEIVPRSTIVLHGAKTITLPIIGHSIGGIAALTIFSNRIRNFLS